MATNKTGTEKTRIEGLMDWIGFIGSFLLAIVYVLWGLINLKETGRTVMEIIGDAALVFALSQSMTFLLRIQGILLGKKNTSYQQTFSLFGDTVVKCSPYMEYGEEFVIDENKSALKQVRVQILMRKAIKYEDHFDDEGSFKEVYFEVPENASKAIKERISDKNKALNEAIDAKITMLQFNDLTSSESKPGDPNYLGETEGEYLTSRSLWGLLLGAVIAIVFSYYGYELIKDFTKEDLIYKSIQISFITVVALIQLLLSYLRVVGPIRSRMTRQINKLEKFFNKYSNIKKEPLKLGLSVEDTPKPKDEGSVNHVNTSQEITNT